MRDTETPPLGIDLCKEQFDFLMAPICQPTEILRAVDGFECGHPWQVIHYDQVRFRRGVWKYECEGGADAHDSEARLMSSEDTLMAFSMARSRSMHTYLRRDKSFAVSLLASPWPKRVHFQKLRIRRLSMFEVSGLILTLALRLARSDRPVSKFLHVVARLLGGRSLRLNGQADAKLAREPGLVANHSCDEFKVISDGVTTAVLRADEELHPRALEIVGCLLREYIDVQAVYADRLEAGQILPQPQWDDVLADHIAYVHSPVFFRGDASHSDPWVRLKFHASEPNAVRRIALPLSSKEHFARQAIPPPPLPELSSRPLVSVVIPTKDRMDLLARCLGGLAARTAYSELEVIIVDNGAPHAQLTEVIGAISTGLRVRKVEDFGPFNFSRLVNLGAKVSSGEVILMLNDDVEPIEEGWLHRIVASAQQPLVGCVGARLLYPDRTIQHAGVMLGLSGVCGHLWKGMSEDEAARIPQIVLPSRRMAVTGACLAIRREVFKRAGGMDETAFAVAFNDIDLCLRVGELGLRTIYRGDAALIHHESQSRGLDDETAERRNRLATETAAFLGRWGHKLHDDPFASPAYDITTESGQTHPSLSRFYANRV